MGVAQTVTEVNPQAAAKLPVQSHTPVDIPVRKFDPQAAAQAPEYFFLIIPKNLKNLKAHNI